MTTLMNERTTIGGATSGAPEPGDADRGGDRHSGRSAPTRIPVLPRPRSRSSRSTSRCCGSPTYARPRSGALGNPGPEGSIAKLALATRQQGASYELCIDLLGADGHRRLRLHVPPSRRSRPRRAARLRPQDVPPDRGPTRSRAARRRSCATSSASASSACPASRASTATSRGRRSREAESLVSWSIARQVADWIAGYERAWRTAGTEGARDVVHGRRDVFDVTVRGRGARPNRNRGAVGSRARRTGRAVHDDVGTRRGRR